MKTFFKSLKIIGNKNFIVFISLSLLLMIFEVISVALIIPLIDIILNDNSETLNKYNFFFKNIKFVTFNTSINLLLFLFVIFIIFKNFFSVFINRYLIKKIFELKVKLQKKMLFIFVNQDYDFHLKKNSSNLINIVNNEINIFAGGYFLPLTSLLSELFIASGLLILIAILNLYGLVFISISVVIPMFIFYRITKKKQIELGYKRNYHDELSLKRLTDGVVGIREIKILDKEKEFVNYYSDQSKQSAKSLVGNLIYQSYTRALLEILMVTSIMLLVFYLITANVNKFEVFTFISVVAAAGFRLLPSITRIVNSFQALDYAKFAVKIIYENLFLEKNIDHQNSKKKISFEKNISLEKVFFKYPSSKKDIFIDTNFIINKNETIGIQGSSGAGKSTLVDLICGLLKPSSGRILVDGFPLQGRLELGYVSQHVYLTDDTIKKNIGFGLKDEDIDLERVLKVIKESQLESFIKSLPDGHETMIGERGLRISGGQKQRICIARALYNNFNFLIFDEATNALDAKTEEDLLSIIMSMKSKKTIIFISHKKMSLKNFDKIYEVIKGKLELKNN
jgi:ABC-type multidrug transport system fused ATPase/permease subunit